MVKCFITVTGTYIVDSHYIIFIMTIMNDIQIQLKIWTTPTVGYEWHKPIKWGIMYVNIYPGTSDVQCDYNFLHNILKKKDYHASIWLENSCIQLSKNE